MAGHNATLLTDLYQLTMVQAYWYEQMHDAAVFSLFVRNLPESRNYLLACGVADALAYLEQFRFEDDALAYLRGRPEFQPAFIDWLAAMRFTGDVRAVREGTPVFANEPILEVRAALPEAQLIETIVMNQVHLQTVLASKAVRVVHAARGRPVVDFGLRRMHGLDAGLKAARAFHIAGIAATSNVLAGQLYGIPLAGTMAHSYIQAHDSELAALRTFTELYPNTTLLVDTYDTLEGVQRVIELALEQGADFRVNAVRLDSGDLRAHACAARQLLDAAGLTAVQIFASGGLDEYDIDELLHAGAPIDAFGVGTRMGVSADAPAVDIVYKLVEYAGRARLKLSTGKANLPGPKQVFRVEQDGVATNDIIAGADENLVGQPLLQLVMQHGRRIPESALDLNEARAYAAAQMARLPEQLLRITHTQSYPVQVSPALAELQRTLARRAEEAQS